MSIINRRISQIERKSKILISFFLMIILALNFMTISFLEPQESDDNPSEAPAPASNVPAHISYTSHATISINGNADFVAQAAAESWSGDGSSVDPYIITGYDIDASSANGIDIRNTNVYFTVSDCYVHGIGVVYSSILLDTCANGTVSKNNCSDNRFGIYLGNLMDSAVSDNNCSNNADCGIYFRASSNSTLSNNNCSNNVNYGLCLELSSNNSLSNNDCSNNIENGIFLYMSNSNNISRNNCSCNSYGVYLFSSSGNNVYSNIFSNNSAHGIRVRDLSDNRIWKNAFYHNNGAGGTYNSLHIQAYDSGINNWWNSTDGFGNYWSDWTTPDTSPQDGVVDNPYDIEGSAGAKDYYPRTIPEPTGTEIVLVDEGFEGSWPGNWQVSDDNPDSGIDNWGPSNVRSYEGSTSLWCAAVGVNSLNGISNLVNRYYDQNETATLQFHLGDISGCEHLSISFCYWAKTGFYAPNDYLCVLGWMGSNWTVLWKQVDAISDWRIVYLSLGCNITDISFTFVSDDNVGLGPYEGVYLDKIKITVIDITPPETCVLPLQTYTSEASFYIQYATQNHGGLEVSYVCLYYRLGGSGNYSLYSTPDNPMGQWNSSVIFFSTNLTGYEGSYEFYTVGIDTEGICEAPPLVSDASTVVDFSPPNTRCNVKGDVGWDGWYTSEVELKFNASDLWSPINSTRYRENQGDWQEYQQKLLLNESGIFSLEFFSTDSAGQLENIQNLTVKIDTEKPELSISYQSNIASFEGWDNQSGIAGYEYFMDFGSWIPCNDSQDIDTSNLAAGQHRLTVSLYDRAGNQVTSFIDFKTSETNIQSPVDLMQIILIAIAILAIAAIVIVTWKWRRGSKEK